MSSLLETLSPPRRSSPVSFPKDIKLPASAESYTPTVKAYKNQDFVSSRAARPIRILCEFEETRQRLCDNGIEGTLLIFGSARSLTKEENAEKIRLAEKAVENCTTDAARVDAESKLDRLRKSAWMADFCESAQQLAKKLTEWTMREDVRTGVAVVTSKGTKKSASHYLNEHKEHTYSSPDECPQQFVVCTGGGPGLMSAANKGASEVPGAKTMGMGISLPFENGLNPYVSSSLAFEFHYFFTRKFWMIYQAKAIIVYPGGFGTFDELFEACTLKQTGKLRQSVPIVLIGATYWKTVINFQALVDYGTISQQDYNDLFFTDSIEDAYNYVVNALVEKEIQK